MDGSILATRRRITFRSRVVHVLVAILLAGCATDPPATAGPGGFVVVNLAWAPGVQPGFFEPIHRARLIGLDGSLAAAWQVNEGATPVRVQPGVYRLEVFTVFLGDTLECVADPAAPGGQRCAQPTLGPDQVCGLDVTVVAGSETRAIFHIPKIGLCGLELEPAPTVT